MAINASESNLKDIPVSQIDRNPENPRIIFQPSELEELLESIRKFGVQVPIAVYRKGGRYILIDGERRWRCCNKLGKDTIPALIQDEPDPLTNLLLMFNIHALREQWDLLTIALKLPRVLKMLETKLQHSPNEREISENTGLARTVIRRCKLLMDLPNNYKDQILEELRKPKGRQKITEDFFIEMERALKTVERAIPTVVDNKDRVRRTLIQKFQDDTIKSRIHFRYLAKIARSEKVHLPRELAEAELKKIFSPNSYSIEESFSKYFASSYQERDLSTTLSSLIQELEFASPEDFDSVTKSKLQALVSIINGLLREG